MSELKSKFTILWVEDKARVISLNQKIIESYFNSERSDFELNIIPENSSRNVKNHLATGGIDILVTDYNLDDGLDGIGIVNLVRELGLLIDILFYSAQHSFNPETIRQSTCNYGFIEVVEGKDISEPLIDLIKKNLKRCEDIIFLRGMVITKAIDLEIKINDVFAKYFNIQDPVKLQHFCDYMLENMNFSIAGKKKTLSSIIKEKKLESLVAGLSGKIMKVCEERNILAHCKTDPHNNQILISMGNEERFNHARLKRIIGTIHSLFIDLDKLIGSL